MEVEENERVRLETLTSAEITPSERCARVRYAIRDVVVVAEQARRAGKRLISLNIGDPLLYDFPTPPHIIEAIHQAMLSGRNGYAPSLGTDDAVEAIRAEAGRQGIRNIREIFVTSGVSEAIDAAIVSLMNPGENLLLPSPGYPLYEAVLTKIGCESQPYTLDESNGWQPDVDDIARRINNKTRAIVIINPNNPTGAVYSKEVLNGVLSLAARHGLVVFSDEIYNKLLLDPVEVISTASLAPELPVVTFNGISKAYLAPGFRIGWGILTGEERCVARYREVMAQILRARLSASHPMQFGIRPALEGSQEHVPVVVEKLRRRRDLMISILNAVPGIHCVPPQAAFYAFPRLDITRPDTEFVTELIRETGVVVVPGDGFGQVPGTKHFRLVFLPPEDQLRAALERIAKFARKWRMEQLQ
jgi:alanine-synthesizing transaminase